MSSLVCVFLAFIGNAFSQIQPDKQAAAYMWSPDMQKSLLALGQYMDKFVLGKNEVCKNKYWLEPISFVILEQLEFPPDKPNPTKGAWTFRYRFDRCGESVIYNALFKTNNEGSPTVFHLPPGTTKTSPQLMQDLNPSLFIAATTRNGEMKDCKTVIVTNTIVSKEHHSLKIEEQTFDGVWEESWSMKTCSGSFTVDFCFIPERTGGTTYTQSKCEPTKIATARWINRKMK